MSSNYESKLNEWILEEKKAIELSKLVAELWLDKSIELIVFRRRLYNLSISEVLNHILYAKNFTELPFTVDVALQLAGAIAAQKMAPSRIDLGRLGSEWIRYQHEYKDEHDFVATKLKDIIDNAAATLKPRDVVLYGFGRIGRLAARAIIDEVDNKQLRLRAIITRGDKPEDISKRASLLRKDSVHGKMPGIIEEDIENGQLIINGHIVHMINSNGPGEIDFTKYGINNAILIDNTGVWRDREGLSKHLNSKGIAKVLLTAPGKGDIPNIVYGVNNKGVDPDSDNVFSAASCTTNAITPVLKLIEEKFGIERGHIETVHSYTNDQNLLDNFHKKYRRGRSAPLNLVITETGAASAIKKVLPDLTNNITGNAVRVPTPDVSLAILNLNLKTPAQRDEIVEVLRKAATKGPYSDLIDYSMDNELVSTDVIGNGHPSVVDGPALIGSEDGKSAVIYVWYDNEFGYTRQVIRLTKQLAKVVRMRYY